MFTAAIIIFGYFILANRCHKREKQSEKNHYGNYVMMCEEDWENLKSK